MDEFRRAIEEIKKKRARQMADEYVAGASFRDLGAKYGMAPATVMEIVTAEGVTLRTKAEDLRLAYAKGRYPGKAPAPPPLPPKQRRNNRILALHHERCTPLQIFERLLREDKQRVQIKTIRDVIRRYETGQIKWTAPEAADGQA